MGTIKSLDRILEDDRYSACIKISASFRGDRMGTVRKGTLCGVREEGKGLPVGDLRCHRRTPVSQNLEAAHAMTWLRHGGPIAGSPAALESHDVGNLEEALPQCVIASALRDVAVLEVARSDRLLPRPDALLFPAGFDDVNGRCRSHLGGRDRRYAHSITSSSTDWQKLEVRLVDSGASDVPASPCKAKKFHQTTEGAARWWRG